MASLNSLTSLTPASDSLHVSTRSPNGTTSPCLISPSVPVSASLAALERTDHLEQSNISQEETTSGPPSACIKSRRQQISIVVASFFLVFTGCGLNFAFGVYQELYETLDGPFAGVSAAEIDLVCLPYFNDLLGIVWLLIALITCFSLMTVAAPFVSAWTKTYSPRFMTVFSAIIFAIANLLASFSQKLWQFILTQGILLGCATCLCYIPAVTVMAGWFEGRRALAIGFVLSGTGLGGVAWAPLLRYLNVVIGFRNTLRVTGVIAFVLISISGLVLKWDPVTATRHVQESSGRSRGFQLPRANWTIARSRAFAAHATASLFQAAAYMSPVYFFSSYASSLGYSGTAGANIISLSNACNFSGKIGLGCIADRYGRLNALLLCTLMSAIVTFALWLPSTTLMDEHTRRRLFLAYASMHRLTASAYISLFPTALAEQFGIQNFASINGLLYMIRGLGTLVGTPLAGALIRGPSSTANGMVANFEKTILMVGILLFASTIAVGWIRMENVLKVGWKWKA